jgi:hypothetical protein
MKTVFTILSLFLCYSPTVRSQSLHIDSTRFITGHECCTQIRYSLPTADKGILFVGEMSGNPGGIIPYFPLDTGVNGNVFIGKIDSLQRISWIKIYGGTDADIAISACQTKDGGYGVLAETFSNNGNVTGFKGTADLWLIKIDDSGNLLWEKCYGSPLDDVPISIANTPDNGLIMLGASNGSGDDVPFHYGDNWTFDWIVIKTDSLGNIKWSKDLGGTGNEGEDGSILSVDSSYYLIGTSNSHDHDCTDTAWHAGVTFANGNYYLLKLNDTGKVLWDSSFGGSGGDIASNAMFDIRDSTIVINGSTNSNDYMVVDCHGSGDIWVIKVNKLGGLIWDKDYGSSRPESGNGICPGTSGGYLAYGGTSGVIGGSDAWVILIDSSGNEIASDIFGGIGNENPTSILPYLNGYVATGTSGSSVFTEGSCNINYSGAFVSYFAVWPLLVNKIISGPDLLLCYPNPAFVNLKIIIPIRPGSISIINIIGQIVYFDEIITPKVIEEINIDNWNKGIYIVRWQGEDGTSLVEKLVCL